MLNIVILDSHEKFLQFLDPNLCDITESQSIDGLKTLNFEYKFQNAAEDKKLFELGNKIWIQGDMKFSDCLYVINTTVNQSIYSDNSFTFEAEEVLVELTYAPLVSHTSLTKNCFNIQTTNDELTVKIDWNSLNHWFGEYFNIGVVQDCLSEYVSYVPFTGTMTRMNLLRHIEEQTGNVFVTRYEKDVLNNTIHRYLDFLNPINVNKNWTLNLEYNFMGEMVSQSFDDEGNPVPEDNSWNVTRFINTHVPTDQSEDVEPYDAEDEAEILVYDTEDSDYEWISEDEMVEDETLIKNYTSYHDIIAENLEFRIVDPNLQEYVVDGTRLAWSASDVDFDANEGTWLISLIQTGDVLGLCVNETSFAVAPGNATDYNDTWVEAVKDGSLTPIPIEDVNVVLNDDSYFEIYDVVFNRTLFRTRINNQIGRVHAEVLDFGFNLENITFGVDETSTYSAVSPILTLNTDNGTNTSLTRANLTDLINRYINLTISKGQTIPMILQKINVTASTLEAAKVKLGSYVENSGANQSTSTSNWWRRPYHPQDQKNDTDSSQNTWEFIRATAYWKAPYRKGGGLYVETDKGYSTQYSEVVGRNDTREDTGPVHTPKMGTTESSDEDIFAIYNQVALYLKAHEDPKINLDVDVANLRGYAFNNYEIHDKIYVKLPDNNELIVAKVTETHKELHDMAKNTIKVSNYTTVNNIKTELQETIIHAQNTSFKYPNSKTLTVRLENLDFGEDESTRTQYPANKLLAFTVYNVDNGTQTFKKNYTKVTNANGYASINMKYDPGDYVVEIHFGGDEEYLETSFSVKVNVSGTKETKTKNTTSTTNKTTKKTTKKVTKTTYYDKYGRSPDKKKILAIGRPSASGDQGSYTFYGMEFKNKCPKCGKKGTLFWDIFYAGNEKGNRGKVRLTGNVEGSSAEGAIFCSNQRCDGDWSCQGREHGYENTRLTATKKRFKSSKTDAYKLKKGKYVYNKKTTTTTSKKVTNNKNRKIIGKPSKKIKNLALKIVGNKTGREALLAICKWMDKNIHYTRYCGFCRSPDRVISSKHGNCCDQTRTILQLFDSAGLSEYYDMYYVHVTGHVYGQVRTKKTGNRTYIDPASDVHGCYGYVCQGYTHGSPSSKYPKMPFSGCQGSC